MQPDQCAGQGETLPSQVNKNQEVTENGPTVQVWMTRALDELSFLGETEARSNAEKLLQELLGWKRVELYTQQDRPIPFELSRKFDHWISLRKKRIPLEYVTGRAFFREEILEVEPGCLIPRPETELLVDCFIRKSGFVPESEFSFLDLGTGSGAIGISILRSFPKAAGYFSDVSRDALTIAQKNTARYGLMDRARFYCGDLFQPFREAGIFQYDAILTNPPYLSERDFKWVEPELGFEPRSALDGGVDGFTFYRRIVAEAGGHLKRGGWLMMEVGAGQAATVIQWMQDQGMSEIQCERDHQGIERVVSGRRTD